MLYSRSNIRHNSTGGAQSGNCRLVLLSRLWFDKLSRKLLWRLHLLPLRAVLGSLGRLVSGKINRGSSGRPCSLWRGQKFGNTPSKIRGKSYMTPNRISSTKTRSSCSTSILSSRKMSKG